MYKVAVIGDKVTILGFKAVGLSVFAAGDGYEARRSVEEAIAQNHAIIYITESLIGEVADIVEKYKDSRIPAIIPIPGVDGSSGFGIASVKKSVERAVGADILFGGE